ncbi:MAG: amidohydrolase family protein [Planctomycetota bacterium]|nr:amidohydrolase family protein [Planctomycetota bacterium]
MSRAQTILGPILNPRANGTVEFTPDGALSCDEAGTIDYAGPAASLPQSLACGERSRTASSRPSRRTTAVITPPFLDAHIHIPQHPIRGRFVEGVGGNPPEGRLIAGLNRNVFPAEARCKDLHVAKQVVETFLADTLANGVVGGSAYMTTHPAAVRIALERLPKEWSVGLVLMNQNCPPTLCTDVTELYGAVEALARDFGTRFILTDRFAVAVDAELRTRAVTLAQNYGLRMQTHLNEQLGEKWLVEHKLCPGYANYTDVYLRDGLLDCDAILAHCVRMCGTEFDVIAGKRASVAHCPTSNTLLGSGIMPLDEVVSRGIDYAICTDVGASPTVSILAEMAQFLKVHAGRSRYGTPSEALFRATFAPARIMHLDEQLGTLSEGRPLNFIEIECEPIPPMARADDVVLMLLGRPDARPLRGALDDLQRFGLDDGPALGLLERDVNETAKRLENRVVRVTLGGHTVYNRPTPPGGSSS